VARMRREGRLPWGGPGEAVADALVASLVPGLKEFGRRWAAGHAPVDAALEPLVFDGLRLDPGALSWRQASDGGVELLDLHASRLGAGKPDTKSPKPRADKLLRGWLQQLVLGAAGRPARLCAIGADLVVCAAPVPADVARGQLAGLMGAWRAGVEGDEPWPTALATGLKLLAGEEPQRAYESDGHHRGDDRDPHLARLYPRYADLAAQPRFAPASELLYTPLAAWLKGLQPQPLPDAAPDDDDADADGSSP